MHSKISRNGAKMQQRCNHKKMQIIERSHSKDNVLFKLALQTKKCLREEMKIGLQYAQLMKEMYQTFLKDIDDEWKTMIVTIDEHTLRIFIKIYEQRWRNLPPSIFIKILQNRETGKPEANFCRKISHTCERMPIEERYMHAVRCTQRRCAKQNLPQEGEEHIAHHRLPEADKFLESYHREKTRDERQLAVDSV